ncbi:CocE/NonD family hydrolase [Gordonia shandongensis]|uniref:CocE/NonD family hydrolase n=1 Tax=Gordonia shandongensis TaxID=376351 RepID=UPI000686F5A4|nr:CocE/NonD family hydrolase [Gordonia shandongensis]
MAVGVAAAVGTSANAGPTGISPAAWTRSHDGPQRYPGIAVIPSVPITMSDGTVLRADVYRPADAANRPVDTKLPVIVNMTPYNKLITMLAEVFYNFPVLQPTITNLLGMLSLRGTPISGAEEITKMLSGGLPSVFSVDQKLVRSGYTQVVVDVRGTGTSQGVWQVFGPREQKDTLEVLNWARHRPYSNGKLGMSGYSYSAINQMQAAAKRPKGLEAIFPAAPMTDIVADVVAPGSGFGAGFLGLWLTLVNSAKFIPDFPSLLRGQFDVKALVQRLQNPAVFFDAYLQGLFAPTVGSLTGAAKDLVSINSTYRKALYTDAAKIDIPTFVTGGWHDLFTNMEWRTLSQLSGLTSDKKKLIMGDFMHITGGWDQNRRGAPPAMDVLQKAWFDKWLKGVDNGIDRYRPATSHQIGGGWVQSDQFPRPGQEHRRLYLTPRRSGTSPTSVRDGSLSDRPTRTAAKWTVAPGITTLCSNDATRDQTGLPLPIDACSQDNRIAERGALTFTSPKVARTTSVNGPLNVHLRTQVDARDGFFSVVASDVAPDGSSHVISTGSMTVSVRDQLVPSKSGYAPNGDLTDPYYALDAYSLKPVKPGAITTLDVGLLGTDALLKPGHRLRVSVYALNAPRAVSFGPISHASQLKPEHILLDPHAPSWITVPSNRPIG